MVIQAKSLDDLQIFGSSLLHGGWNPKRPVERFANKDYKQLKLILPCT